MRMVIQPVGYTFSYWGAGFGFAPYYPKALVDSLYVFYVSPYKEEWEADAEDMKNDLAVVYVENVTGPDLSEFGTIQYKSAGGGLIRIR